ncbi:MAG TPA: NAD(+) synthase [Clostridia bacterium]|nr:NAD(+) synthase [Clostridia bacterium]
MTNLGFIKVAAMSPRVVVADPEKNMKSAFDFIMRAKGEQAQIIVLPELHLSGYTCGDLFNQDTLIEECEKALSSLLLKTKSIKSFIVIGMPIRVSGKLYNSAVAFQSGQILGVVPKKHLANDSECYEKRWFVSGRGCAQPTIHLCDRQVPFGDIIFELSNDVRVGIEIGEDLLVPVSPSALMALGGANVMLNLSASNELVTKNDFRHELILQQSAKLICAYIYAGAGVGESSTDLVFSGACIIAENGKTIAQSKRFEQKGSSAFGVIDVQKLSALRRVSYFNDNYEDCSPTVSFQRVKAILPYITESAIDREYNAHPFVPSDEIQRNKRCREIIAIQASGLAKRLSHTGIKKAIVGISGGLDSTLALLVIDETMKILDLPKKNIICVTMPGFGTTARTKNNAIELVECVGAQLKEISIEQACIGHMKDIGHDMKVQDITYENVQARERTQILMDLANKENALLVGTGDLSELALGWCTYNADHMSMYSVNCGVPKTLIRYLIEFVSNYSEPKMKKVLEAVIETPVSPELLPPDKNGEITQKTEEKLGPYEVHDFFLYHFFRFGSKPEKILFMAERAFNDKYTIHQLRLWLCVFIKRFFSQQFKRSCLPDGPKVGTVNLSPRGDWRMPSDASFSAWLSDLDIKE